MKRLRSIGLCSCLLLLRISLSAQVILPYKNASLPIAERVQDLLHRMTPEEKFRQLFMVAGDLGKNPDQFNEGLFGFQVNANAIAAATDEQLLDYTSTSDAIETAEKINHIQHYFIEQTRLGIPIIAFDEALHGLVRNGATSFPQSIALAATWDTSLMHKVAAAIADECKERGIRQILSPVVNLATDVRWGRVEETYGEDPYLSAAMGVAYVSAFEKKGIITTPKHFIVNHGEGGRDSYPIDDSERELDEKYAIPFKACVLEGGSRSIMTAYNSLNGRPCSANDWLLNKKLKDEWGFQGFVISDAAATGGANVLHFTASGYEDAGKQSIENGLDVIFQTGFDSYDLFKKPFLNGEADEAKVDSAVARVLRAKFELGLFEHPYIEIPSMNKKDRLQHRSLSEQAAEESIVLLKNDTTHCLPLKTEYKKIALIGVDAVEARLGGYSGPGNDKINILTGLQEVYGKEKTIVYEPGCGREVKTWKTVESRYLSCQENGQTQEGLRGAYFNNITLEGKPVVSRLDKVINFQWTLFSPAPTINYDFFSCSWQGQLLSPQTGSFHIGIEGNDGYRFYINGRLLLDTWDKTSFDTQLVPFNFEKGTSYPIQIEYKEASGNARLKLIWNVGCVDSSEEKINAAVALAKQSDVAVIVAGIEEGEFLDRSHLNLPGRQEEMIQRIAATGTPVVVLLSGGSAITMNAWLSKVHAVMQLWYPGETGGKAVAKILSGEVNASGKLPFTVPITEGQLPLVYNHKPTGRGDDYLDGSGMALFPFGYGLSYTTFEYSDLHLSKEPAWSEVSLTIKNSGHYEGDEVVQLYIRDELSSVAKPVKELAGFQRVHLGIGEEKQITFRITPSVLRTLNEQMKWVVEPGTFRIMVGSSSKDIRARAILTID